MLNVRNFKLVSDQVDYKEIEVIIREATRVLEVGLRGAFVELGCYTGTTSLFLRRLLDEYQATNEFHIYDSFSGLPDKTQQDNSPAGMQFKSGELHATKAQLIRNFKQAHLQLPIIHTGWFEELRPKDVPETIAFAFLDGDFYTSIKSSLRVVAPNLQPGAVIVIDDYANEALPGARKATDEWARQQVYEVTSESSLGIIKIR
jgi:O-methyltransferase